MFFCVLNLLTFYTLRLIITVYNICFYLFVYPFSPSSFVPQSPGFPLGSSSFCPKHSLSSACLFAHEPVCMCVCVPQHVS